LFIVRTGHAWLISIQLASFIVYLVYVARYFNAIASLILQSREALASSENSSAVNRERPTALGG
jgi:hypothetical protein